MKSTKHGDTHRHNISIFGGSPFWATLWQQFYYDNQQHRKDTLPRILLAVTLADVLYNITVH